MKKPFLRMAAFLLGLALLPWIFSARGSSDEDKVWSKRRDLPLLESASASAKPVAKANWNEALAVESRAGRWLKVSGADGEGWVYSGNVSTEKLPEENQNNLAIKASSMTAAAAGRGLEPAAEGYASRHNLKEVAEQVAWAEHLNAEISKEDARAYLKGRQLGEYSEAK